MNIWTVKENPTSMGSVFQNTSVPLWEFYELHKEKSIVQLLSSEYMCLGDIHSVKTIVQLRKPPNSENQLIFSNHFLAPSPTKKGYLPEVFKTLKNSYLKPLLKSVYKFRRRKLCKLCILQHKKVSSLIQNKNIKKRITWSLTASPLSSRQNCLKKFEHSSMKINHLFSH